MVRNAYLLDITSTKGIGKVTNCVLAMWMLRLLFTFFCIVSMPKQYWNPLGNAWI